MAVQLLDVNVLLALFDSQHAQHDAAHRWFSVHENHGWATCPLTENGFVRISSSPSYPSLPGDAAMITSSLMSFCDSPYHVFWAANVRLGDLISPGSVLLHTHITDLYLLGLARDRGGNLATFDRRIPASLIDGGASVLTLIPM